MKHFAIDEVKELIKDMKNSDEKKSLYIVFGVLAMLSVVVMGITAIAIKKHCCLCENNEYYDNWDNDYDDGDSDKKIEEE